jgi:hypothetical protein
MSVIVVGSHVSMFVKSFAFGRCLRIECCVIDSKSYQNIVGTKCMYRSLTCMTGSMLGCNAYIIRTCTVVDFTGARVPGQHVRCWHASLSSFACSSYVVPCPRSILPPAAVAVKQIPNWYRLVCTHPHIVFYELYSLFKTFFKASDSPAWSRENDAAPEDHHHHTSLHSARHTWERKPWLPPVASPAIVVAPPRAVGSGMDTALMSASINTSLRPLIDAIDDLRALGVNQDIAIPQIAVIGDQSSGKERRRRFAARKMYDPPRNMCEGELYGKHGSM